MWMIVQMEDAGAHNKNITATKERWASSTGAGVLMAHAYWSQQQGKQQLLEGPKSSRPLLVCRLGQNVIFKAWKWTLVRWAWIFSYMYILFCLCGYLFALLCHVFENIHCVREKNGIWWKKMIEMKICEV